MTHANDNGEIVAARLDHGLSLKGRPKSGGTKSALPQRDCSADERPRFELARVKPRRAARGLETAGVKVTWPDGEVELLWMTAADIMENIETWGRCNGLAAALDAYLPNTQLRDAAPALFAPRKRSSRPLSSPTKA